MMQQSSESLALFKQLLHRFPTGFEKRVRNRMSISWVRTKSLHGIWKSLGIVADVVTETYAPSNSSTCFYNDRAKVCGQVPKVYSLTNKLDFFQFTQKSDSLDVSFLAANTCDYIKPTNGSLGHFYESLRRNRGASLGHSFRTVSNPYCDTDSCYCAYCLYPSCSSSGGQRVYNIPKSKSNVQDAKNSKKRNEAENGPVRKVEVFEHIQSLLSSQKQYELIFVQHAGARSGG